MLVVEPEVDDETLSECALRSGPRAYKGYHQRGLSSGIGLY
jgi:hypothetical protein